MPLNPADIAFDVGDNPTQPAPTAAQKKIVAKNLSLAPNLLPRIISGNGHTMTADNESEYLLFTSTTATTLTLIQFSAVAQGFMVYIDEAGATPLLDTLPAGMTIPSEDQATFNTLEPGKRCFFYCVDATPGAQVVHIL